MVSPFFLDGYKMISLFFYSFNTEKKEREKRTKNIIWAMEKELMNVKGLTLHFNLWEPRNKYTNIYAVLRLGMRQTKIPMPYKVKSWLWDKKKEIPLTNSEMTSDEIANAKEIYNAISSLRYGEKINTEIAQQR